MKLLWMILAFLMTWAAIYDSRKGWGPTFSITLYVFIAVIAYGHALGGAP